MNYGAVMSGPFSSTHNGGNHYPRLNCTSNYYGHQSEMTGQPSAVMQQHQQQISTDTDMYRPISTEVTLKDPKNYHVGSKLFVGQVPSMTSEEQLRPVFEPYGTLLEVKIMRDRTGRSKGSAWVRYATDEMARNAIVALHEKHTVPPQTNPLRVQFATPNTSRNQQQNTYTRDPMGLPNKYNVTGPIDSGNMQPTGMTMMRHGSNTGNVVPSVSAASGGRYIPHSIGSHVDSSSIMAGSYTSSVNRFDTNPDNSRRDFSYSFADRSQGVQPVPYQQQRNFIPPFSSPHMYGTPQAVMRGNGGGPFDPIMGANNPNKNMKLDVGVSLDRAM